MEQVPAFKTKDGCLFETADQAAEHEVSVEWRGRIGAFAQHPLCPYPHGSQLGMMSKSIIAWERYKVQMMGS